MSFYSKLKRFVIGKPLPNDAYKTERLNNFQGLAVLSSDAISSNAYATEEILKVLVLAGVAGLGISIWITVAIVSLLAIVVLSYRQTVAAYPSGGGAYIVAKTNLGRNPGLLAAASLMIDPDTSTTVIIPVAVTRHWWEELLHNQTAFFLKNALQSKSQAVITTVRYYL